MLAKLCYRIAEEAGMAETETGEPAKAYLSFSLKDDDGNITDVDEKKYAVLHQSGIVTMASMLGVDTSLIEKISLEEYNEEAGDDE